jgi:tight adherence protein B
VKRLIVIAALVLAAVSASEGVAADRVQLTEARGASFPERAFVIALPTIRPLSTEDVDVSENGNSVIDASIVPASEAVHTTFGVVLVIDASESMAGTPIRSAMAAARAFASRRNANQRLAVVTFNGTSRVLLPFTTSQSMIDAALRGVPRVAYGTHIYDAVAEAEQMLAASNVKSGSILVLSDGADTGSAASASDIVAGARTTHIKLFAVGLHSPHFDGTALQTFAAGGGGEYAVAKSTAELAPLFDQLCARLSREYVLRYKSLAGPDATVHVRVTIPGLGSAASAYDTPALAIPTVRPYHASIASRIWSSPILLVLVALFAAASLAVLGIGLLQPRSSGLPHRMAEFVSVPGLQIHSRRSAAAGPAEADSDRRPGALERLDEALEIAEIHTSGAVLIGSAAIATVIAFLLLLAATGSGWWALLAVLVPLGTREFVVRKLARRRNQFAEQLPDTLQVISSALRSGHSLAGALAVVVESSAEPMKSEMQQVVADEQRGIPLEQAMTVVSKRMASRDLEQVALVAELQRSAGSNAAEVVDRVAETIRERFELRRLVKTLTVQGRMSRWIVTALPVGIILILQVVNPHYLHPLFAHTGGRVLFGFAVTMCILGSLVIKKIVDIKV